MKATLAIAVFIGAILLTAPASADSLLALPDGDTLTLWDTSTSPAIARIKGVSTGAPGVCYLTKGERLVPDSEITACLSHLNITYDPVTGGAPPYDITGIIRAQDGPVNDYSTGFAVTGVTGIAACGEREDCSTIYIIGTRSDAALQALAEAVQSGKRVRMRGLGVWNFESIDIIIDDITPSR